MVVVYTLGNTLTKFHNDRSIRTEITAIYSALPSLRMEQTQNFERDYIRIMFFFFGNTFAVVDYWNTPKPINSKFIPLYTEELSILLKTFFRAQNRKFYALTKYKQSPFFQIFVLQILRSATKKSFNILTDFFFLFQVIPSQDMMSSATHVLKNPSRN